MDDIGTWPEPLGLISLLIGAAVVWLGARAAPAPPIGWCAVS